MSVGESKPVKGEAGEEGSAEYVNIRVKGQDGWIVHFKMKRKTQLKKLMETYCNHQSLQMDQIRFLFDGNRLRETQSPDELEMEDDDIIDAFQPSYPNWKIHEAESRKAFQHKIRQHQHRAGVPASLSVSLSVSLSLSLSLYE